MVGDGGNGGSAGIGVPDGTGGARGAGGPFYGKPGTHG
ncbi:hypothetical protein MSIMFI_04700 [Mycobacterium simulans]|nr:hypothetical protein MSIMFI_04700 [Mycobacterium simulans]